MFGLKWRLLGLRIESVFSRPTISGSVEETGRDGRGGVRMSGTAGSRRDKSLPCLVEPWLLVALELGGVWLYSRSREGYFSGAVLRPDPPACSEQLGRRIGCRLASNWVGSSFVK